MSRLREAISGVLNAIAPAPGPRLTPWLKAELAKAPLTVVDVGAAMGVDARWAGLGDRTCRFITFEPDERSAITETETTLAFPVALGAKKGRETLRLTVGPFASSLHAHNHAFIDRFAVAPWHAPAGEVELEVEKLDTLMKSRTGWTPDFVKTDVEGFDLDVLKGAAATLKSALGVQAEVSFVERHLNSPYFADIDAFLRSQGFVLFQLSREEWVRRNGLFGPGSRAQLIWGDAVYFRDLPGLAVLLNAAPDHDALFLRLMALLLAFDAHDFAREVLDQRRARLSPRLAQELDSALSASARGPALFTLRRLITSLIAALLFLAAAPFGARLRGVFGAILADQTGPLLRRLYRASQRTGLERSCIADPL